MKKIILLFLFFTSSFLIAQSKSNVFTIYNDEVILTGSDRLNLYTDVIDTIKILKGEESSDYFEKAGGVIIIFLRNNLNKQFLTKAEINQILHLPSDREIYINGIKLLKELKISYNKQTTFEKLKINEKYYCNVLLN